MKSDVFALHHNAKKANLNLTNIICNLNDLDDNWTEIRTHNSIIQSNFTTKTEKFSKTVFSISYDQLFIQQLDLSAFCNLQSRILHLAISAQQNIDLSPLKMCSVTQLSLSDCLVDLKTLNEKKTWCKLSFFKCKFINHQSSSYIKAKNISLVNCPIQDLFNFISTTIVLRDIEEITKFPRSQNIVILNSSINSTSVNSQVKLLSLFNTTLLKFSLSKYQKLKSIIIDSKLNEDYQQYNNRKQQVNKLNMLQQGQIKSLEYHNKQIRYFNAQLLGKLTQQIQSLIFQSNNFE
ncbi:Hypothetical_protein [Hexamita inflata]|uniref:Hypothetical_protein n=1 Tax=Hexamita inflata TaxID=28002 RepID=A0AA86U3M0_9EUKA|nr:Hypothetical protein HINF_LOCUS28620 [Hexamita inflata]